MRKLSINSVRNFRECNRGSSVRKMFFRGKPIFTRNGEQLFNIDIFMMTDQEVVDCVEAEYQEEPNPLGYVAEPVNQEEAKPTNREVFNAVDQLRKVGVDIRIVWE